MIRERLEPALRALWFARSPGPAAAVAGALLSPLSRLTARVAARQRARILALPEPPVPVVVVGNLVVGGAGKTPLVTAIVSALAERGWKPAIVASGYGASREDARLVGPDDPPETAGDEALLLAQLSARPVAAGRRRAEALAPLLAAHPEIDVVVSDDGLQHAALPRTLEIAVFDRRGAGNGRLLPAGPLREPLAHLATMDAVALNGDEASVPDVPDAATRPAAAAAATAASSPTGPQTFRFRVVPYRFVRVDGLGEPLSGAAFRALVESRSPARGAVRLAAVAGIGEPKRLFDTLAGLGLNPGRRLAPGDHRTIDAATLRALDVDFVVMTTKDAVKCRRWADDRCWALEVRAEPEPGFVDWLDHELREASLGQTSAGHPGVPDLQGPAEA